MGTSSNVHLVVMGPSCVGKSAITFRFLNNDFITDWDVTVEDTWSHVKKIDGVSVRVDILDTAGMCDYITDLSQFVADKNGVILVYDITNRNSFESVKKQYTQMVEDFPDGFPSTIILGNKKDLVSKTNEAIVKTEEAEEKCREWGVLFEETSAKTDERISESFVSII